MKKMKWKKGQASVDKQWVCILDEKNIQTGYYFIRPHHKGGPTLDREMVKGHGVTFRRRRPCFHLDCFETMGSWFGSIPPVYDNSGERRLPLQDPTLHLPDGKPVKARSVRLAKPQK